MAVKVLWSHQEAIILLDALIQILSGEIDRKTAITNVSSALRKRAINSGLEIDDIFRNTNGITFQMSSMEYILTDGAHGLNKPVKVFREVVELYKNNRPRYDEL